MDKDKLNTAIQEAKELVSRQEEPFRTAAFQVVLSHLISDYGHPRIRGDSSSSKVEDLSHLQETAEWMPKLTVPQEELDGILTLKDPERIPVVWSFSDREWMGLTEFFSAAEQTGIPFGKSWLHGGNFNNRLYEKKQLFSKKGKGKDTKYKLSATGRLEVKKILERRHKEGMSNK